MQVQFLVTAEARGTAVGDAGRRLRKAVGTALQRIEGSGRLLAGGVVAGRRMTFLLLELDSSDELLELLGPELMDNVQCAVCPVAPFEGLGQFLEPRPI
jgi:hypothetical protein